MSLQKTRRLPEKLELNKLYNVEVKEKGWLKGQVIGVAENRAVTLLRDAGKGKRIRAKVIENKNNIYMMK